MWTCLNLRESTSRLRVRHMTGHAATLYLSHARRAYPVVRGVPLGARGGRREHRVVLLACEHATAVDITERPT
jgi:hypothetical protein